MGRDVPFDANDVCDECGAKGAFDFMGDCLCVACSDKALSAAYEPNAIYYAEADHVEYVTDDVSCVVRQMTPDFAVLFDMKDTSRIVGVRLSGTVIRSAYPLQAGNGGAND